MWYFPLTNLYLFYQEDFVQDVFILSRINLKKYKILYKWNLLFSKIGMNLFIDGLANIARKFILIIYSL